MTDDLKIKVIPATITTRTEGTPVSVEHYVSHPAGQTSTTTGAHIENNRVTVVNHVDLDIMRRLIAAYDEEMLAKVETVVHPYHGKPG